MKAASLLIAFLLASAHVFAQDPPFISKSIAHAAQAAATPREPGSAAHRGTLIWSGLALGVAGATMSALAVTALRVEDRSTGNAPKSTYQACVAQRADPIYASNQCDALKGRNSRLLWGGVAVGAVGAALLIGGVETRAELEAGTVRWVNRIRF